MPELNVCKIDVAERDECGKSKKGVAYDLGNRFGDSAGPSFLCWEHLRSMLAALTQADVLAPRPIKQQIVTTCECRHSCCQHPMDDTRPRNRGSWSDTHTESVTAGHRGPPRHS